MHAKKAHPSYAKGVLFNYRRGERITSARSSVIYINRSYAIKVHDPTRNAMKDRHYDSDDELLSAGNNGYTYDADGDRISETINGVTTAFGYDYDNQLVSITTGSNVVGYAYDALGRRVSRTAGGVTTTSLYDGGRVILEEQGGNFTGTYTYGVSLIRRNREFFQYDALGSARTFTNASGVETATAVYDGYGNTVATSGSTASPYQFGATSGYRNDGDAGIMQVAARYYDPATGSFLTRDTDLNQLAYLYCGDDPVNMLDPSGHAWWDTISCILKDVAIGTVIAIISAMVPEAAPVIVNIGLGALGGSMIAGNQYYYDTPPEDWDNGQLRNTVIRGGIEGGVLGGRGIPPFANKVKQILKIP